MSAGPPTLPPYTPSGGAQRPLREAFVSVDCAAPPTDLHRLWTGIGYDEINWTYTPFGRQALSLIGRFAERPYYVRTHYVFCSGPGLSIPHWGSGNVYHEDEAGDPVYDFTITDRVYDTVLSAGHRPLIELAFTPLKLVPKRAEEEFPFEPSPSQYSAYEAGLWSYPPSDYRKWADLVAALVEHCVERYGSKEVAEWPWEVWNEPNIYYWRGTARQYHELYRMAAHAIRDILPEAKVGGPATTGDYGGQDFLRDFLSQCQQNDTPIDFVSFHTKGGRFDPWRTYAPIGTPPPARQSPSLLKMLREVRASLAVVSEFRDFRELPCLVDECDASVPAHWSLYDNPNFAYRNSEYYAAFQCKLMKKLLDLNQEQEASVQLAMTWSFYFEGETYFQGTRSLFTTNLVEKPVLNAYRMLARMHDFRVTASSSEAWALSNLDGEEAGMPEEIDVLATTDGSSRVAALVWRHADDQYHTDPTSAEVRVQLSNLQPGDYPWLIREWRIDRSHSNSHSAWRQLGSPLDPTAEQLASIKKSQGMALLGSHDAYVAPDGSLEVRISLPLPSVSLIEVEPPATQRPSEDHA